MEGAVRDDAEQAIRTAIDAARAAIRDIRALPDPQSRIEAAGRLADGLRVAFEEAARIRHEEAVRIYETESLSLAQLANRVGISKARADQIINTDRKRKKEAEDD